MSMVDELEGLIKRRNNGELTPEEFEDMKKKILERKRHVSDAPVKVVLHDDITVDAEMGIKVLKLIKEMDEGDGIDYYNLRSAALKKGIDGPMLDEILIRDVNVRLALELSKRIT